MAPRLEWMASVLQGSLGATEADTTSCLDGNEDTLARWFKEGAEGTQTWFYKENGRLFMTSRAPELKGKSVYFLKQTHKVVSQKTRSDDNLIYGEISKTGLLPALEGCVNQVYGRILKDAGEWGELTDEDPKKEFLKRERDFSECIERNIQNMDTHIDLPMPKKEQYRRLLDKTYEHGFDEVLEDEGAVSAFAERVKKWTANIQKHIDDDPSLRLPTTSDVVHQGPKDEIDFWGRRMVTLTKTSDTLASPTFQAVLAIVKQASDEETVRGFEEGGREPPKSPASRKPMLSRLNSAGKFSTVRQRLEEEDDQEDGPLVRVWKRWQRCDLMLSEALNEAKDNAKFLNNLRQFVQPLYSQNCSGMADALPGLFSNIKMILTISRHYCTKARMTNLLVRVTHQMVVRCRSCINNAGAEHELWDKDPKTVIKVMKQCLDLLEKYKACYKSTAEKLNEMPKGRQFVFDYECVFGEFKRFGRRLAKLADMFSSIQQFSLLKSQYIDGLQGITRAFDELIADFRKKKHNLLAHGETAFERDYVEFTMHNSALEMQIQQFIERSFARVSDIDGALDMLEKFRLILHRDAMRADLDQKYMQIFKSYGKQLIAIQEQYEGQKNNPPIGRNYTRIAGNIAWSRQLLRRISHPMDRFKKNPRVFHPKESRRIVKNYNRLARTLIEFETIYFETWRKAAEGAKMRLQARLLVQHKTTRQLYANFDRRILELMREGKFLLRMGFEIPPSARVVLLLQDKLKSNFATVKHVTEMYNEMNRATNPKIKAILQPHFEFLRRKLQRGLSTLTWTSMTIEAYVEEIKNTIQRLADLIAHINDTLQNRVRANFKRISQTCLVETPSDRSFTRKEFLQVQGESIGEKSAFLMTKNKEVETAIEDVIKDIKDFPHQAEDCEVDEAEFNKVRHYYQMMQYHSLLSCIKRSLNAIKNRASTRSQKLFLLDTAFFEVDLSLQVPHVRVSPSLDDIQEAINNIASKVLHAPSQIMDWGVNEDGSTRERVSYFQQLGADKNVVIVVLLLTGAVEDTKQFVKNHLKKYANYSWLWLKEPAEAYAEFMSTKPLLSDFVEELQRVAAVEAEVDAFSCVESLASFNLRTANLKLQLKHECQRWKLQFSEKLHDEVRAHLERIVKLVRDFKGKLSREVKDFASLKFIIDVLHEIRDTESWIESDFLSINQRYDILDKFLPPEAIGKAEMDNRGMLKTMWDELLKQADIIRDEVNNTEGIFRKSLLKKIGIFRQNVGEFRTAYDSEGPMEEGIEPLEAISRLNKFGREFDSLDRKYELYKSGEKLFGLPNESYPAILQTRGELVLLRSLYGLYDLVLNSLEDYKNISWNSVVANIESMQQTFEGYEKSTKKLNKAVKQWPAYRSLVGQINSFMEILPLLEAMAKPSMRQRHWEEISSITGTTFDMEQFDDLKLRKVLDADLFKYLEDLEEICDGADKQLKIENELDAIDKQWQEESFEFSEFKSRGEVILNGGICNDVIEKLEESMANLNQMLTMKHVVPFRERTESTLRTLSDVNDTLERWIKLQQLWMSLESVFTSGDIARQMPADTRVFLKVDKEWISRYMTKAKELRVVVQCCTNEYMKSVLPTMMESLERCQKALDGYLENKRNAFPRFYFVSNPALLLILSQGSDKKAVQGSFAKVFDAISKVTFDGDKIVSMKNTKSGYAGKTDVEEIKLTRPIDTRGNIEEWLGALEKEMKRTMHREIRKVAGETGSLEIADIIARNCAQCALLSVQFQWTTNVEEALAICRSDKEAMAKCLQGQKDLLQTLSKMTVDEIPRKMDRRNIETLVTIQVHQNDVLAHIVKLYGKKQIRNVADFEWQKQMRVYWAEEDKMCRVKVADVSFNYCWEYLGCKERLVVTPLTDRAYITLTQACAMYFGGSPAGPAGTGKTETVKDLGRALGKYVVVFNCSDQMRYTDTAKIYKGLCQSGSWGCFDEFNRIELEVLSVVAQQISAILGAMRGREKEFFFPGDLDHKVTLDARCGFFITMNPGYAGRQELPENLKAQFRMVAMMVPDFGLIIKVKLASVGYYNFEPLAKKFDSLYLLSKEQLSKQRHYDFGLRNILSVLRTAGANLRRELKAGAGGSRANLEEMVMMRTLRDMNMSKLVGDDVGLFNSLLQDLFPNQPDPEKARYMDVETALDEVIAKRNLTNHKPWVAKIIQLYETSLVRHGLMMIGPAGGGKSAATWCLLEALQLVHKKKHVEVRLNPKAMLSTQLFGENDTVSGEWTDGVFSSIWSKFNDTTKNQVTWINCDGPVDTIWIESLNTVLDDNKLLTLANGDRIPMTDNVKILFEAEDLRNASPATVSRAGIIFVDTDALGYEPVVAAWLQARESKHERKVFGELYRKYIGDSDIFTWMRKNTKMVFDTWDMHLCQNLLLLIDALCKELDEDEETPPEWYERQWVYAMAWTIGGLYERGEQIRFHEKLMEINEGNLMPKWDEDCTVYEYYVDMKTAEWVRWKAKEWQFPKRFKFAECIIPTGDSVRCEFLLNKLSFESSKPCLVLGSGGTGKTSNVAGYMQNLPAEMMKKSVSFSSATTCQMLQDNIEADVEKRQGKTFAPPANRRMTVFLDDVSMPEINMWGDQPTLEIVRQLIEFSGFYFLEKDKRGDRKIIEGLTYLSAMSHPGGGRNDVPNRLKRHFFSFNLTPPSLGAIDDIYGSILRGYYADSEELVSLTSRLTTSTISLWQKVRAKMLPTPSKFHYVFNMFDLSRIFGGCVHAPTDVVADCPSLLKLWIHECERVFSDKLVSTEDQEWYRKCMVELLSNDFNADYAGLSDAYDKAPTFFADFFREDVIDPETDEVAELAPKIYEAADSFPACRDQCLDYLEKYNDPSCRTRKAMPLVLFDDAVKHALRIARILSQPRGNALLVGLGGSGRQSLTRLAAYIARHELFQIKLTRTYKTADFLEDLKTCLTMCGKENKQVTFLLTDSDIICEDFLEYINMLLATGMVPGLFPKEERDMMCADCRTDAKKAGIEDTHDNLVKFLLNRIRDNFHIVLAFSPANKKFAERARKFPSLISGTTIDWFLRWPSDALQAVSGKFIDNEQFEVECTPETKASLVAHIANVHDIVVNSCDEYFQRYRRHTYVTPKSYLSFIDNYQKIYTRKLHSIHKRSDNVKLGLQKIAKATEDVGKMSVALDAQKEDLIKAEANTKKMLGELEVGSKQAMEQKAAASKIEQSALATKNVIDQETAEANKELEAALPFMEAANAAAEALTDDHIRTVKALKTPHDLIRRIMDTVLLLLKKPLCSVSNMEIDVMKEPQAFIKDSYKEHALKSMSADFVKIVKAFAGDGGGKDYITEETMELLEPYLARADFLPEPATKKAAAAGGLCAYVRAMYDYHNAALIVGPRMAALEKKQIELDAAMSELRAAQAQSQGAQDKVDEMQRTFEATMAEKKRIEDTAQATADKMLKASQLIKSLGGEQSRWREDEKKFQTQIDQLVGDSAIACAFVSYCGPYNYVFRNKLVKEYFYDDCVAKSIPVTKDLDVNGFLVDDSTIAQWNSESLPKDDLSIQNGILVTQAARYPLIIDPQAQATQWILERESQNMPHFGTTSLNNKRLRDQLKYCMQEGKPLIIEGVEEEVDPMMDPVLEGNKFKQGKTFYIKLGDEDAEINPNFRIYMITKLSNPHFSPELFAKSTVIDFAVTQQGLEDQLLSRVINTEQQQLEEQKKKLIQDINANTIQLLSLDKTLLEKLSASKGDLLEDIELINTLNETKRLASSVGKAIVSAKQTEEIINKKREQYRAVATRGSVLYFVIVDMAVVNWMYQTSLSQFLRWFDASLAESKKANLVSKRVENIIKYMTFHVYDNMNRGLFGEDKLTYKLMNCTRVQATEGSLAQQDIQLFLQAGTCVEAKHVPKKPVDWLSQDAWRNMVALARGNKFYSDLLNSIVKNEKEWAVWYNNEAPEAKEIPGYEEQLGQTGNSSFLRMMLVRSIRADRTMFACDEYIGHALGPEFTKPLTTTMDEIWDSADNATPIVMVLTPGADPTATLKELARSKGVEIGIVSMGEGQEPYATKAITDAMKEGGWALLQNTHLGLKYMSELPEMIKKFHDETEVAEDFRVWLTCEAHDQYPIALLQTSVHVTQEAPQGMKSGLLRSYRTVVDRDRLQRVDRPEWRNLVFAMCMLHSSVQERRKFGPVGWNIPYEYNMSDLEACLLFLERHMFSGETISWPTVQYMVCEAQYGGRITDDLDRRLFNTYGAKWLGPQVFKEDFTFCSTKGFDYVIPKTTSEQIEASGCKLYQDYIMTLPNKDSPEIYGLHPNADLTYGQTAARRMLDTIQDTQPRGSAGGGGKTREEIVKEKCQELVERMSHCHYKENIFRDKIKNRPTAETQYVLQRKDVKGVDGFTIPLNVFLYQEIVRLSDTINRVRKTLESLVSAIDGVVIMTPQLQLALDSISAGRPPKFWFVDASGAQIAWERPTLPLWFQELLDREAQLTSWLNNGRPNVYWMTGFFNPQGFLTAMKQEVTRRHKADRWALDDVTTKTIFRDEYDPRRIRNPPDDGGVYIRGLFLDGCSWDPKAKMICESKPKELYTQLPIVHVTAVTKAQSQKSGKKGQKIYSMPVYTVPKRTDLNYVFMMDIPSKKPADHWTLRGVAALCSKN